MSGGAADLLGGFTNAIGGLTQGLAGVSNGATKLERQELMFEERGRASVKVQSWQFWNLINMTQSANFLFAGILAMFALAELAQKDVLSTEQWWIMAVALTGWSLLANFMAYHVLYRYGPTDQDDNHVNTFLVQLWHAVGVDAINMALLVSFHHQNATATIQSFNNSRNDSAVTFSVRVHGAWYAIMAVIIAGFMVRLHTMLMSWERHLYPKMGRILRAR
ncbi:MAG: hypothetical protein JKY23_06045 [Nitrospinaceae bacterium]|nr:hypothetical protein [Nitrospinaceae bacterium]